MRLPSSPRQSGDVILHVALNGGLQFSLDRLRRSNLTRISRSSSSETSRRDKAVPMLDLVEQAKQRSFVAFGQLG